MRASDRDRERAVALLRARCIEGYLSVDTFEHRLGRVLRARSLAELRVLVGDVTRRRRTWPRWRAARMTPRARAIGGLPSCPVVAGRPLGRTAHPKLIPRARPRRCGPLSLGDALRALAQLAHQHQEQRPQDYA
jgi:hypothetical protein